MPDTPTNRLDEGEETLHVSEPSQEAAGPPPGDDKPSSGDTVAGSSRRRFLGKSARKLAYLAPVVLLFKPDQALAGSSGSWITV